MPDTAADYRPFYKRAWPRAKRDAAKALWHWHLALHAPQHPSLDGADLAAYFKSEREKVEAGAPLKVVEPDIYEPAYRAREEYQLPRTLLAQQVEGAHRRLPPVRFINRAALRTFLDQWAVPHARLLAHLGGATGSWQLPRVDELAHGFFHVGRLAELPRDLENDRLFIPQEALQQQDVTLETLQDGEVTENVRRLLWKEIVQARDHMAQGRKLADDLTGRMRRAFKRWWLGALAVVREIEERDYDVWSEPIRLTRFQRLRVRFQALAGRMTFR